MTDALQPSLFPALIPPAAPELPPIDVAAHKRRRVVPKPRTGPARRDAALDDIEEKRHDWLEQARLVALRLCSKLGTIAADDIDIPLPTGAHPSTRGNIFRSPWFIATGAMRHSRTPQRNAGRISVYALTEAGRLAALKEGLE